MQLEGRDVDAVDDDSLGASSRASVAPSASPLAYPTPAPVTDDGGVGDVSRTSLVGVSVHHSFNRGVNIHGGRGATVNGTTIYKNLGHAFFVEDGSETGNTFAGCLGALTLRAMSLLESDQTPSTFWITNPDNGAAAARSARAGARTPSLTVGGHNASWAVCRVCLGSL